MLPKIKKPAHAGESLKLAPRVQTRPTLRYNEDEIVLKTFKSNSDPTAFEYLLIPLGISRIQNEYPHAFIKYSDINIYIHIYALNIKGYPLHPGYHCHVIREHNTSGLKQIPVFLH